MKAIVINLDPAEDFCKRFAALAVIAICLLCLRSLLDGVTP